MARSGSGELLDATIQKVVQALFLNPTINGGITHGSIEKLKNDIESWKNSYKHIVEATIKVIESNQENMSIMILENLVHDQLIKITRTQFEIWRRALPEKYVDRKNRAE